MEEHPPACGTCATAMSERAENRWFCPRCTEYGRHVGTVEWNDPQHPGFEQALRTQPTVAIGYDVVVGNGDKTTSAGTIVEYEAETRIYTIRTDLEAPFEETMRYLKRETLLALGWFPNAGENQMQPPEHVGQVIWLE